MFSLCTFVRFNDFGVDGGPAATELAPKLHLAKSHLSSRLGVTLPSVEVFMMFFALWLSISMCVFCMTWRMICI